MKLSIIIVSYNTEKLTLSCINSIIKYKPSFPYEILVVDNASSDGSIRAFEKLGKKIVLIKNSENLGFAKANNIAIRKAKGKYILLLNSDTQAISHIFDKLVEFAEVHPQAGVVAPKLLNSDKTTQASIYRLPTIFRAIQQYWFGKSGVLDKYSVENKDFVPVESVVGAAFLITPEAIKRAGGLDEKYFMYFEDLDYCRQVSANGLKVYYLPKLSIIHHHGASGNKSVNNLLIDSSKKYFGALYYYVYTFVLWSGQKIKHL